MNYPNLPNSNLEITEQPEVKEITNELLKQLQSALLIFKEQGKEVKKEYIKAFQGDPKTIYYFLVTQDNDSKLITGLKVKPIYIKAEIDKADIIHSFIPQARTLKE